MWGKVGETKNKKQQQQRPVTPCLHAGAFQSARLLDGRGTRLPWNAAVLDAPTRFISECPEVQEYNQDLHRHRFSFPLTLGSLFLEALS